MNYLPNDTRLTARIPASVKETLQKAAELSGATSLNQFLVQAALKEAHSNSLTLILHSPCVSPALYTGLRWLEAVHE